LFSADFHAFPPTAVTENFPLVYSARILRNRPLLTSCRDYCREFEENSKDASVSCDINCYLQSDTSLVVGGSAACILCP